jgi:hypothetical protein
MAALVKNRAMQLERRKFDEQEVIYPDRSNSRAIREAANAIEPLI